MISKSVQLLVILMALFFFNQFFALNYSFSQYKNINDEYLSDWVDGRPDGCTTITVGKKASVDGSVTTSHTVIVIALVPGSTLCRQNHIRRARWTSC
jgi:hypothetical protein